MNSIEFKNTVCRICLDENVVVDWSSPLVEYCDVTYEDCYYKYTQLKPIDEDPFSSMLCQVCSNSLEGVHALISKALDSYSFLLEVNCMNCETEVSSIIEDDQNYTNTNFETVLVEKVDTELPVQDHVEYENFGEFLKSSVKTEIDTYQKCTTEEIEIGEFSNLENEYEECKIVQTIELDITKEEVSKSIKSPCRKSKRNDVSKAEKEDGSEGSFNDDNYNQKREKTHNTRYKKGTQTGMLDNKTKANGVQNGDTQKRRKLKTRIEDTPCMCSYCSKILHNIYALQRHEKIHLNTRERKAACPICGVKFFEEAYVKSHMQIHNENRIKKHKCEFCDKAFFERGALNVHRRVHLGQMIPCKLCSKEFYRKVDLDIHMNTHSATLISSEKKKRSRYYVRCKYCNKNILSTSFKSHTAAHLNEPLMKCSICNKEFFWRDTCTQHLKNIHKKTSEEYNDFIILYSKNRLSHLYLEQTADLKVE